MILSRLSTGSALLTVVLLLLLPLYELADLGEHWPNDGNIVAVLLAVLFIFAISLIYRGIAGACVLALKRGWQYVPRREVRSRSTSCFHRSDAPLFLIFCDFRV